MSERIVPVKLQEGKVYLVEQHGKTYEMVASKRPPANSHDWALTSKDGTEFWVNPDGNDGFSVKLLRPVYEVGQYYERRNAPPVLISELTDDTDNRPYVLDGEYCIDGKFYHTGEQHSRDLMDYVQPDGEKLPVSVLTSWDTLVATPVDKFAQPEQEEPAVSPIIPLPKLVPLDAPDAAPDAAPVQPQLSREGKQACWNEWLSKYRDTSRPEQLMDTLLECRRKMENA